MRPWHPFEDDDVIRQSQCCLGIMSDFRGVMRVFVPSTSRMVVDQEGVVWVANPSFGYQFWTRYLDGFDEVVILCRARPVATSPDGWHAVTGASVAAHILPYYEGPIEFARKLFAIRRTIRRASILGQAVIIRAPSLLGNTVANMLPPTFPIGLEVVGDPHDVFAPGAMSHPGRALFRWWGVRSLTNLCRRASAVAYVTSESLQRRYPANPLAFQTHYSSIMLPEEWLRTDLKHIKGDDERLQIIMTGTLAQMYKAPDVLLHSLGGIADQGIDWHLKIAGGGRHQDDMERLARRLGIAERVEFLGHVGDRSRLRELLDEADLFVLPSRQEGLPRAVIEAMARGLPCISTTVGGIPELLPSEDLVPPNDAQALADAMATVLVDPQRRWAMSKRNLQTAANYVAPVLRARRMEMYERVRAETEEWLERQSAS